MGSLYVTSPAFVTHTTDRRELLSRSADLFTAVASGILKLPPIRTYSLADAARAHADLQGRRTTASNILVP